MPRSVFAPPAKSRTASRWSGCGSPIDDRIGISNRRAELTAEPPVAAESGCVGCRVHSGWRSPSYQPTAKTPQRWPPMTGPPTLRAHLLGSVRLAVGERVLGDGNWPRRSARTLLLLLL